MRLFATSMLISGRPLLGKSMASYHRSLLDVLEMPYTRRKQHEIPSHKTDCCEFVLVCQDYWTPSTTTQKNDSALLRHSPVLCILNGYYGKFTSPMCKAWRPGCGNFPAIPNHTEDRIMQLDLDFVTCKQAEQKGVGAWHLNLLRGGRVTHRLAAPSWPPSWLPTFADSVMVRLQLHLLGCAKSTTSPPMLAFMRI